MSNDTYTFQMSWGASAPSPQNVNGSISVAGTLRDPQNNGVAGTVTLQLDNDCTFRSNGLSTIVCQAEQTGRIEEQLFTSSKQVIGGQVHGTPTNPPGLPDSKSFTFYAAETVNMTLNVSPTSQVGDGKLGIIATATVMDGQVPQNGVNVIFSQTDLSNARFNGQNSQTASGLTDSNGVATASLADTVKTGVEVGFIVAEMSNQPNANPITQQVSFSAPGQATATLSGSNNATFVAAEGSFEATVVVMGDDGSPVADAQVEFTILGNDAYFTPPLPGQKGTQSAIMTTQQNGAATVTVTSFTWGSDFVTAAITFDNTRLKNAEPIYPPDLPFTSRAPSGLKLAQGDTDYYKDSNKEWITYVDGAPASLGCAVRVGAAYFLNDKKWAGYGDVNFSITEDSHAQMIGISDNWSAPTRALTARYNAAQYQNYEPSTTDPVDAQALVRDGYLEDAIICMSQYPLTATPPGQIASRSLTFGSPWADVKMIDVTYVGTATNSAFIYDNGRHQAYIKVTLNLADAYGASLTNSNQPPIEDIQYAVNLVDATMNANNEYKTPNNTNSDIRNSKFRFVIATINDSNIFRKQIYSGSQTEPDIAARYDDESGVTNGVAYLYYFIVFSDMSALNSTRVGMLIKPNYHFSGPDADPVTIRFLDKAALPSGPNGIPSDGSTITLNGLVELDYDSSNLAVTSSPVTNTNRQSDIGPVVFIGNDYIENYSRLWNFDISLQGGSLIYGGFIYGTNPASPQQDTWPEDNCLSDSRTGLYQTKLYIWQDNCYCISEQDFANNDFRKATSASTSNTRTVLLAGIPNQTVPAPPNQKLRLTVAAGFGDLSASIAVTQYLNLKVVDVFGNVGEFNVNVTELPIPANLISNIANWQPLKDGSVESNSMFSSVPGRDVHVRRLNTSDNGQSYDNSTDSMSVCDADGAVNSFAGGDPFEFKSAQTYATNFDAQQFNNVRLLQLSTMHNNKNVYNYSFNPKNGVNDNGYHVVVATSDITIADRIQLKPSWTNGAAMIFATPSKATSTDGTYWAWDGITSGSPNMPNIMIFAYAYGATAVSGRAYWTLELQK